MNVLLPCSPQEAAAFFVSPQWVYRIAGSTNHDDIIEAFRLFHSVCWSDKDKCPTDPVIKTERGKKKYGRILRRLKSIEEYTAQHKQYPVNYGEDNISSDEDIINESTPPLPRHRPTVPGDFVLTFHVLAVGNSFESKFPCRSEYWWTLLPGNLDQACVCFSMQAWVDQLATCEDEESFLTTYNSFLDTTWQALQGLEQCTGNFPYKKPTDDETRRAYFMKNRTLLLHNQIVWGKEADDDKPVIPSKGEQSQEQSARGSASSTQQGEKGKSDDQDGDDPNKEKPDATPPSKGDEAQDKPRKKETQEATLEGGEQKQKRAAETERDEALEKVKELKRRLKQAEDAAKEAAEDQARRTGEELAQEIDDEKARKEKKRESKKEKKRRKKQKKDGHEGPPSGDENESDDSDEKEGKEEKDAEGESNKPEADKDKNREGKEKSEEESKVKGKDQTKEGDSKPKGEESTTKEKESEKTEEGPPKDEEPEETWAEIIRKARKPRQVNTAAEKARARTYPRPMCGEDAKPNYASKRVQHVPTKDLIYSERWDVQDKPKDIPRRNAIKLGKDTVHKAILEHGTRKRYSDFKVTVLQVLNARRQLPPRASPFALAGQETYCVQTTIQLNEDSALPFSELPGMYPRLYTFDKFWEIPRRQEGYQLKGIALGVAQYVVGTFDLESKRKAATMKSYVDNDPFWLNAEVFKAARVLIKEVSAFHH